MCAELGVLLCLLDGAELPRCDLGPLDFRGVELKLSLRLSIKRSATPSIFTLRLASSSPVVTALRAASSMSLLLSLFDD